MARFFSRARATASTVRLFLSRATRKDAFAARNLTLVTALNFEEAYRVVLRGKRDGIDPLHIVWTMTALNLNLDDAMKMIDDPDTPY